MTEPAKSTSCPISQAIQALADQVTPVGSETVPISQASGRYLTKAVTADRDSPACDVSAMDGYAAQAKYWSPDKFYSIAGECAAGSPPIELPTGKVCKIFTGAPLPVAADAVIEREVAALNEQGDVRFTLNDGELAVGRNIRFRGENIRAGEIVLPAASELTSVAVAALASFGPPEITVQRRLKVGVISTGSELTPAGGQVESWQIRDSNSPMLHAMLQAHRWLDIQSIVSVRDEPTLLQAAMDQSLETCDTLLLTGGVSVGDHDYVPQILAKFAVRTVFHRLPQRPGRPVLGGIGPKGQLVFGLPGNPVSVAVTARRIALPLMRYMASGDRSCLDRRSIPINVTADDKTLPIVWYRLVKFTTDGTLQLMPNRGSGDLVSLGNSDGFIEVNPFEQQESGVYPFYAW